MMRSFPFLLCVLVVGCGSCEGDDPQVEPNPEATSLPTPDLRVAIVTDLQGTLAPCGCTSHPLGGVDRLVQAVQDARAEVPTVFVAAGDLLAGGVGHVGPSTPEQDGWRAETLAEALRSAELAAAGGGPADEEVEAPASCSSLFLRAT